MKARAIIGAMPIGDWGQQNGTKATAPDFDAYIAINTALFLNPVHVKQHRSS